MAEGSRMHWAISLLTMMFLLPFLSAAPLDIAGDIKKEDVKDDNDGMHSHDENVTRRGKFFGHNRFDVGDMNISGSVTGDVVSIGHQVKIDVHGHTHDHHHREDDTVTIQEQREFSPPRLQPKGSFDECQFKTCGELCQTGVCDGHGFCVDPLENPCEQHGCEGKSCGDLCLAGDIVGNCDIDGNCDFDIDRAFNSCDKQEAPKQEGERCGSCFCPPTYSAGDCAEGLTCVTDERIPDAPGICTRPGGREEPEEKKVVIPCRFNDDILAPRFLPNGQKSPHDTSHVFQWTNNIVPYYFSNDDYSNEWRKAKDRKFVRGVMDKFEEKTCFRFVEKSKNQLRMEKIRNKLEVNEHVLEINIKDVSCDLGNAGVVFPVAGTTRLQLYLATHVTGEYPDGSKCRNEGLVIHELMHAFGVGHTHRRSDRDTFIQVILDNLKPNVHKQYDICKKCVLHKEIPYECGSIMHYGSHDNTEDLDKAVIVPLAKEKCQLPRKSLQRYDASAMDWQLLNIIGECPKVNGQASPDVQSSPENYPEKLANVGLVLRGYDIMRGNPLPLKEILLDPGLRLPIFEATYHEDSKTPDHRYLQPDGVDILNCADSCSKEFKTDQFSGAKSYQQSLSNEVGFSLGGSSGAWGAKFSASAGFRKVSDKTSSDSKTFTMSSATCCAYRAEIRYDHQSLNKHFLRDLEDLTEKYEEKIYLRFISKYGTHFITRATMGSKFIHLKEISKETVSTLHQNGVDIEAAAEFDAYAATGSVDTSSTNDNSMMDSFSSEADIQNTYTIGAQFPEDGMAKTWIQKPLTNPAPIQLELMEIVDLLDLHKGIEVSAAVKDNLQKAMNDYCGVFLKDGLVSTCSAPTDSVQWSGIQTKIWGNDECKNTGNFGYPKLEDCKKKCLEIDACTAINYNKLSKACVTRGCTQPVPAPQWQYGSYKGYYIMGHQRPLIVYGRWSAWSSWSDCTGPCGAARRTRTRACSIPAGGKSCPGAATETKSCDLCHGSSCTSTVSTLSSNGFKRHESNLKKDITKMHVVQKKSHSQCTEGVSFGFQGSEAWVDKGCRAEFRFTFCQSRISTGEAGGPTFLIVAGDHVLAESFDDIEKAKAKLMEVTTRSRLIAEVYSSGNLKRDPHKVGGQNQGGGSAAGFNKYWNDWNDINRMMDVAQRFLDGNTDCIETGVYITRGNNVDHMPTSGKEECSSACASTDGCVGWTLLTSNNYCWLKSDDSSKGKAEGWITGTKNC